jgi:hypothetical protein
MMRRTIFIGLEVFVLLKGLTRDFSHATLLQTPLLLRQRLREH